VTATVAARPQSAVTDWLLLAGPGLIWGASFLFIAEGLEAIAPNGLTFVRILVGFAALACVPAARRPLASPDKAGIFWLGLLWFAFPLSMFPFAEQRISSALTGMLNGSTPLFTALVAAVLARAMPSRGIVAGLFVGLTGAVLVAWPSLDQGRSSLEGVLLVLVAIIAYGVALNIARPLQQRHGALPVIWRAQAVALVLTAPLGVPDLVHAHWSARPLLALLALGALGTAVAQVVITIAAGRLGATRASATTFLIPPVALLLGVLVRHERVAVVSVAGGAICVAGAWLIRRAQAAV
jgi:drug/metabolite transporter (DMT)-like permease